jgi:hypothetical protein
MLVNPGFKSVVFTPPLPILLNHIYVIINNI